MKLSRKRRKQVKRLRGQAESLWAEQQDLAERANVLAKEAKVQAGHYAREQVYPRVRHNYQQYVQPRVERGVRCARKANDRVTDALVPVAGGLLGTGLRIVDVANDARLKASGKQVAKAKKSGMGFGGYFALGASLALVAGIGYAVFQTFRADDELWVAEESAGLEQSPDTPQ